MYEIIVPDFAYKELSKIDKENQQLIFDKIKDLKCQKALKYKY